MMRTAVHDHRHQQGVWSGAVDLGSSILDTRDSGGVVSQQVVNAWSGSMLG
jgi:hypothetical protein